MTNFDTTLCFSLFSPATLTFSLSLCLLLIICLNFVFCVFIHTQANSIWIHTLLVVSDCKMLLALAFRRESSSTFASSLVSCLVTLVIDVAAVVCFSSSTLLAGTVCLKWQSGNSLAVRRLLLHTLSHFTGPSSLLLVLLLPLFTQSHFCWCSFLSFTRLQT